MRLRILDPAALEAAEAAARYEAIQPRLGADFRRRVREALLSVRERPDAFPLWRYSRRQPPVRRLLLERFPFAVLYELRVDEVVVVAIAHQRRRPGYWRDRA